MTRLLSASPAAARMRRLRARRKLGVCQHRVHLFEDWCAGLIDLGLLTEAEATDYRRLVAAIGDFADHALIDALANQERAQEHDANIAASGPVLDRAPKDDARDSGRPMTIIVAVKCSDGVVIAADGMAVASVEWQGHILPTGRYRNRKIRLLPGPQIGAFVTDSLGAVEHFCAVAVQVADDIPTAADPMDHAAAVTKALLQRLLATGAATVTGGGLVVQPQMEAVLAFPHGGEPQCFIFNRLCQPSPVPPQCFMIALGAGKLFADPFMSYLLEAFGGDPPDVRLGTMLAVWTIEYAARASQATFGGPISVAVMERAAGSICTVRELGTDEVDEQRDRMRGAASALRGWYAIEEQRGQLQATGIE